MNVSGRPTGWLSRRQRDGGVDEVPLPDSVAGRLWLCGKHAIGPDHELVLAEVGGSAYVVCLTERHELADRYPAYVEWLDAPASPSRWFPIHDLHAPAIDDMVELVAEVVDLLGSGRNVVVHCAAGMGRAGTTAVCVLVSLGLGVGEATSVVARSRPGAGPEAGVQRELVAAVAERAR